MKKHILFAIIAATAFAATANAAVSKSTVKATDEFAIYDTILSGDLDLVSMARQCKLGKTREITVVVSEGPPRVEKKCKQTCKLNATTQKNEWYDDEEGCSTTSRTIEGDVSNVSGGSVSGF